MTENEDVKKRQIEKYNAAVEEYGVSSKAVLADDLQRQYLRFGELVRYLDLSDSRKTVLDIGCGNGEIYKFLNFMGFRGKYLGFDINDGLLAQARARFEDIDVRNVDILTEESERRYDYVVMSGVFNINVGQSMDWVHAFLERMFDRCEETMVFNLVTTYVNFKEDKMFYIDPAEMLSFCIKNLSRRTTLAHHNMPYNYTIAVFRDDSWSSIKESNV